MPKNREKSHFRLAFEWIAGISIGLILALIAKPVQAADQPNILMIVADDLGFADLGVLGSTDMRTPHLDQLYADSLRLNRYYANSPVCSPTRAAVMTGFYPDRVGVPGVIRTDDANSWGYFSPVTKTLPQVLGEEGYETIAIGKWHLGLRAENHPLRRGFEQFEGFLGDMMDDYYSHRRHGNNYMRSGSEPIEPKGHATDIFSDWAVDFIKAKGDRRFPKPWFMYLAYNAPHTPIQPPEQWLKTVKQREPEIAPQRAAMVALIEHLDAGIGRVIEALRESEQYGKTAIVFTSDNGGQVNVGANNGPLRDGKGSMYEGGLRIPGCIRVPARTKPGTSTDAICSTMDLLPTLAELAGGVPPVGIDGISLVPLLTNPDRLWPQREIYFVRREGGIPYSGLTIEAILRGNLKLVHNLPTAKFELYDLDRDPRETADLAEKAPRALMAMLTQLQYHVQRGGGMAWQKPQQEFWPVPAGR